MGLNPTSVKREIISQLTYTIETKVSACNKALGDLSEALLSEGKSSAGDKYETGRAMIHQEMDQTKRQLAQWKDLAVRLASQNPEVILDKAEMGALVETDKGYLFFFAALGEVTWNGRKVFCLGPTSPLGQVFLGKKAGDTVPFRQQVYSILSVI